MAKILSLGFTVAKYLWTNIPIRFYCDQIFSLGFTVANYLWPGILINICGQVQAEALDWLLEIAIEMHRQVHQQV